MSIRPYLELIRLPLAPTAIADSTAGFALAWSILAARSGAGGGDRVAGAMAAGSREPGGFPLAALAIAAGVALTSVLSYWFGMVTNDLFDRRKDAVAAPRHPLVRGAVPARSALGLAIALAAAAIAAATAAGVLPVLLVLLAAILAYNGGGKRIPVAGNVLMGSCRGLNLLLGAAGAALATGTGSAGRGFPLESRWPAGGWSAAWRAAAEGQILLAAALLALYIAAVTAISLLEDAPYRRGRTRLALAGLLVFPVTLAALGREHAGAWLNAAVLALLIAHRYARLPRSAAPPGTASHPASAAVATGLRGLYLIDAGIVWTRGLAGAAAVIYALLALGWLCRRATVESTSPTGDRRQQPDQPRGGSRRGPDG